MGVAAACLVVPPLADRYGRKKIVLFCMAICIAGYAWALVTSDINVLIIIMFFEGLVTAGRIPVAYIYMQE